MMSRPARTGLAAVLAAVLATGAVVGVRNTNTAGRTHLVAYFDNSNGVFRGDEVVILGVKVGEIDKIEPQPQRAKISFWLDDKYKVPADVKAVILSPQLITSRAIQLTPVYTAGPTLTNNAVIPQNRTAVPVEWDDFRRQLEKLSSSLQPTGPGQVSPLGSYINTTADNLRGQGANIRDAIIKLSEAFSALGDHSNDIFSTVKNLSTLVSALQTSTGLMRQLNNNLAAVSELFANDGNELGDMLRDLNTVAHDAQGFLADNREALGTTSDRLASISQALADSLDDIKQALHVFPNALQNLLNIYEPAHASLTGILAFNNFSNTIQFLCGAVQAASRLNAQQSAKLCVQYMAPIIKNRQYNFPPIGTNPFVGVMARPNEVTYSEDWMRPDNRPAPPPANTNDTPPAAPVPPPPASPPPANPAPVTAEGATPPAGPATVATDPAAGLTGMMVPPGGGS
jgi:phospholipid/cholesterol/gamma-HCH transport system substrate-binding protein